MKENYYHLYISLKDRIRFESELINKQISFYSDVNQLNSSRYYLLEKDKKEIDTVLKENEIIANDETSSIIENEDKIKIYKIYIGICIIIILFILLIDFIK